jgi:signal transduction histidine kinase
MRLFRFTSIRSKLLVLILLTAILIIIVGFTFIIPSNVKTMRRSMLNNTIMTTRLISEYCVSPLTFDSKQGASLILSKLESMPAVENGVLYDDKNKLYAVYTLTGDTLELPEFGRCPYYKFEDGFLYTCEPVIFLDKKLGTVYIQASTATLTTEIRNYLFTMALLIIGLMLMAFFLANWFQRIISNPILRLAYLMRRVSKEGDYSLRAKQKTDDEIGVLFDGFNNMLEQIQKREEERDKAKENLLQAKEKAEEADKLKSAFLANMSHEIRTPMNAIVGFAGLLTEPGISDKERLEFVQHINNSSNNLLSLVDDIIDISKIEAGQIQIKEKVCKINNLLSDLYITYNKLRSKQPNRDIDLVLKTPDEDITILTDEFRLRQVFQNLLNNAFKFTEKGYIEFGYKVLPNDLLLFYVKDTGIGITSDQEKLIFERFNKAENEHSKKIYRGAGLGLTICKSIITMLSGNIWVESNYQQGSTFFFTLPHKPVEIPDKKEPDASAVKAPPDIDWNNKIILIAEDEKSNYLFLETILHKTKAKIVWATNGKEAVDLALNNNISVVLMDIKMPVMDGYEATKKIKQAKNELPVISQTAFVMEGEVEKSLNAGCDDYIHKPINPDLLLMKLFRFLN